MKLFIDQIPQAYDEFMQYLDSKPIFSSQYTEAVTVLNELENALSQYGDSILSQVVVGYLLCTENMFKDLVNDVLLTQNDYIVSDYVSYLREVTVSSLKEAKAYGVV